ncbi:MAG: 5'-nucleotidase, lipoprotein e(P4) family [Gemmatirosa sp.]
MPTPALRCAVVLSAALLAACAPAATPMSAPAPVAAAATRPVSNDLRWFRTAAERRALFLQAYRVAGEQLARLAEGRAAGSWAVILDADETVLDNSPYSQARAAMDSVYTPESWTHWVERRAAVALPGAATFVAGVRAAGGRVVIVTNRTAAECPATRDNLRRVGVTVDAVLCQTGPSDKNPRFESVARGVEGLPPLTVLMWVGDNIQDFPRLTQAGTRAAPDSAFAEFGRRFIVVPNPMYGSWERNPVPPAGYP